jgi:hypothetical protein
MVKVDVLVVNIFNVSVRDEYHPKLKDLAPLKHILGKLGSEYVYPIMQD